MTSIISVVLGNYLLTILLLFTGVGLTVSLYLEPSPLQSTYEAKEPVTIFKSGRFIEHSLKNAGLKNFDEIEKHLIARYQSTDVIKTVILDEYGYLLVFIKESQENSNLLEGYRYQLQQNI